MQHMQQTLCLSLTYSAEMATYEGKVHFLQFDVDRHYQQLQLDVHVPMQPNMHLGHLKLDINGMMMI